MDNVITGTVLEIYPVKEISAKFSVREFKVKTDDEYPQIFNIQTSNKNMAQVEKLKVGDKVSVKYNLKGRDYNDKNYISIDGWSISVKSGKASDGAIAPTKPKSEAVRASKEDEDLPF